MKIRKRLAALPLTVLVALAPNVQAQNLGGIETEQNQQQRRDAQQREAAVSAPAVRSTVAKIETFPALPTETPCFRIDRFALDVPDTLSATAHAKGASALPLDPFAFAREWLDHYKGQCVSKQGIDILSKGLQQAVLSRGYVTTRVLVPQQDLTTGTLSFALVPGLVRQLRLVDPSMWGAWKNAFPVSGGDLLNMRDLEQGLEQMKRVASQDVDMKIEPTDIPGESDVVVSVRRAKPWTFVASVDNSGTSSTGKWQGNVSLGIDNPLGLNDVFTVGANQDLSFGNKALGSHGFNGSYSIPFGYWTATLSGNTNTYYQNIAGVNQTFVSSGNSQSAALRIARVISRGQNDVLGGYLQLSKRFGDSFIDDTTIPTQARNNTFLELGVTDRHYLGAAQFDGTLAYRRGIGGLGATPDPYVEGPTYRFHMTVLDANLSIPFAVGNQTFRYVGTVHGQFTNDTLFYIDDLTIGSRYTVRGFDGETMLAAGRGFYWRNELQWRVLQTGQTLYAGIDYGRVFGPNTAALIGTQLAGAVVGIRGSVPAKYVGVTYDLFAGTPIYKPEGFPSARWTVGFQLTAQF
ncbi:ShlB/FhaC/HecB family hemolysin secretion/activation protein [Paraburkholderia phenoliruptrix]|uniref:ShlB/FhaC/HecB family hemolysin secretion/activation protein n=1 Tax=Paraburkholderia phenoliruptrix TaxID=252970 RepID=UPI0028699D8F|nr:ShlB/FhaC/HecB family hemolysin secretion/activation protein [Paraburkholderia phenoliruptrix]WMY09821.1 ShlB/FhaC/HecB family hemolysin secretion/activation protein [Paraburkholderia phenoliruptrix]